MLSAATKKPFLDFARSARRCEALLVLRWYNSRLKVVMPVEGLVRFMGITRSRATFIINELVDEYAAATRGQEGISLSPSGESYLYGIYSIYGIRDIADVDEQLQQLRQKHPVYLYGIPRAKVDIHAQQIAPVKFAKAVMETMKPWERLASALAIASDFDKTFESDTIARKININKTDIAIRDIPAIYYARSIFNVPIRASRLTSIAFLPNLTGKSMKLDEIEESLGKTWFWPRYVLHYTINKYVKECGQFDLISYENNVVKPMLQSGLGVVYEVAEKVDKCFRLAPGQVAISVTPIYYVASHGLYKQDEILNPVDSTDSMSKLYSIKKEVGKTEYERIVSKSMLHMARSKICEIVGSDRYVVPKALLQKVKTWKSSSLEQAKKQLERVLDGTAYIKPIIEHMIKEKGIYPDQLADRLHKSRATVGSILETLRASGLIVPTSRGKQYPIWLLPTRESADILSRDMFLELYGTTEDAARKVGQESITQVLQKLVMYKKVDIESLGLETTAKYELARYFGRLQEYMLVTAKGPEVAINEQSDRPSKIMDLFTTSWAVGDVLDANIDNLQDTFESILMNKIGEEVKDTRENIINGL